MPTLTATLCPSPRAALSPSERPAHEASPSDGPPFGAPLPPLGTSSLRSSLRAPTPSRADSPDPSHELIADRGVSSAPSLELPASSSPPAAAGGGRGARSSSATDRWGPGLPVMLEMVANAELRAESSSLPNLSIPLLIEVPSSILVRSMLAMSVAPASMFFRIRVAP